MIDDDNKDVVINEDLKLRRKQQNFKEVDKNKEEEKESYKKIIHNH